MVIQFICRGNAFRSIIAEAYLNSLRLPNVTVVSSGTVASKHKDGNTVRFQKVTALLKKHGIDQYAKTHFADDINQKSLDATDIAICLNKRVYDEAVSSYILPEQTYIWDVKDIGENGRIPISDAELTSYTEDTYNTITKNIDDLQLKIRL